MSLVAAKSYRENYVGNVFGNVFVEGFDFIELMLLPLNQFESLCANFWRGIEAAVFELCVPLRHLFPTLKSSQFDVGSFRLGTRGLFLGVFVLRHVDQVRTLPT